jgi:hypothetical protein
VLFCWLSLEWWCGCEWGWWFGFVVVCGFVWFVCFVVLCVEGVVLVFGFGVVVFVFFVCWFVWVVGCVGCGVLLVFVVFVVGWFFCVFGVFVMGGCC